MKKLFFLFFIMLTFCNGSCENSEKQVDAAPVGPALSGGGDLTSREGILKYLQQEYDGLGEEDVCIEEVDSFENLFVVGFFAHDRGCSVDRMYYKGSELPGGHSQASKIMTSNNFKNDAENVVENYHMDVINTFKTIVWDINEDFESKSIAYNKPTTYKEGNKVVSEIWIQRPSGMVKERSYYLSILTFDKDGNFISLEQQQLFSVAY